MTLIVFERFQGDDGALVEQLVSAAVASVEASAYRETLMIARAEKERPSAPPFKAAVITGSVAPDRVDAHLLLYPARLITHLDHHTSDVTAIRRVPRLLEPSPATRLELRTAEELASAVGRLAKACVLEGAPDSAQISAEFGRILQGWEMRQDVLTDELFARRANALAREGRASQALALLKARAVVHDSALIARAESIVLREIDTDNPDRSVAALRRAVADPLNPERNSDLANLVQIVPILDEPEGDRLLADLASDATYGQAWWISRLSGMLAYRRATRASARDGRNTARSFASEAARHYDKAIEGHESARAIAIDEELDPWPDVPASPILSANAYDAHHLAAHMTRAKRRHDTAMNRCIELAQYATDAAIQGALDAGLVACERVVGVGWTTEPTVRALTVASVIAETRGDADEAQASWQRARQIDAMKATTIRRQLADVLPGTAR